MRSDRWEQIDEFYHAALEREESERAAFLDKACSGDAELRREVESLLASHVGARTFLGAPALEVAVPSMKPAMSRAAGEPRP